MTNHFPNIAIFASGSGSNFQAIADAIAEHRVHANLVLLVCDNPNAIVIERAQKWDVETLILQPKMFQSKADYEQKIADKLKEKGVQWIVLAGYMRIIGERLLDLFPNKIINIHPALLPSFPGAHGIKDAFEYGVKVFGVTIHYVDSGIDTGAIIDQEAFKIKPGMCIEDVEIEIHKIEHQLYPKVLQKLLHN
ncbi:MAG: phosphoribosylglycinamide formyltransferase [Bacteroidales bacterium]|jgi:phosphoribosylglycinamide formyltransferase-1|nr:phosphoribosylglycinamide formyltransferase [Bacteroidales bacterium]